MPGLDFYFASDPCFKAKFQSTNKWLGRLTKRYRLYSNWEKAVFEKGQKTQILLITDREVPLYQKFYGTEHKRFHLLPPNIDKRHFKENSMKFLIYSILLLCKYSFWILVILFLVSNASNALAAS